MIFLHHLSRVRPGFLRSSVYSSTDSGGTVGSVKVVIEKDSSTNTIYPRREYWSTVSSFSDVNQVPT